MTVLEIVKKYLQDNKYDGLVLSDHECGCTIEDFAPCMDGPEQRCEAAYRSRESEHQKDEWGNKTDWMVPVSTYDNPNPRG